MSEWKKKHEVMLHYDQTAASYETQYAKEQDEKMEAALSGGYLKKNSLILDVGCGTGLLFPHIADKARLLVGIDTSAKLLKRARKRAKRHLNITLVRADADHTPFRNQTFHILFAITLLQNMPDPTATLKEMGRIAKPEATIVLTALKKRFTRRAITQLLKRTRLEIITLKTTPKIRDHIIKCQYSRVHDENS